jgi:hypothetical protein
MFHGVVMIVVMIAMHGVVILAFHGIVMIASWCSNDTFHGVVITVFCNMIRSSRSSSYVPSMTKSFLSLSGLLNSKCQQY